MKMADRFEKIRGNEILVIACWEKNEIFEGQSQPDSENPAAEGYIIVGGNSADI